MGVGGFDNPGSETWGSSPKRDIKTSEPFYRLIHHVPHIVLLANVSVSIDDHIGFRAGFNENCGRLFLYVLAYELVHVLQKRKSKEAPNQTQGPGLVLEVEADRIACEVLGGTRFSEFTADSPEIARFWGPAGHYWTIYLISLAAGWSRHAALTNAFYAQMPDQSKNWMRQKLVRII